MTSNNMHKKFQIENSIANLSYTPETTPSTDQQTERQAERLRRAEVFIWVESHLSGWDHGFDK